MRYLKLSVAILVASMASALAAEPREALMTYKDLCKKGDTHALWQKTVLPSVVLPQIEKLYRQKMQERVDYFKKGWDYEIMDQKEEGDCAVVVINENKKSDAPANDYDPIYLLKRDGDWKFFINLSSWKAAKELAPEKVETFQRLEKWFEKRKQELKQVEKK